MIVLQILFIFIGFSQKTFATSCGIYQSYDEMNSMKFHETSNFTAVLSDVNNQTSNKFLLIDSNCKFFIDGFVDLKFNITIEAINSNISFLFKANSKIYTANSFIKMEMKGLTLFFENSGSSDDGEAVENAIFEFLAESCLVIYVV